MKQEAFEARYAASWQTFEEWIALLSKPGLFQTTNPRVHAKIAQEFPARYRQVCHHLSLARARRYSAGLQHRLNELALGGHQHLYRGRTPLLTSVLRFFARDFPETFRRMRHFMLASAILLFVPAITMAIAVQSHPDIIYSLMSPTEVGNMESMYDPELRTLGRERESDTDLNMFGYYIYNNISIGFQTFAGGLVFGLGSIFYLVFNGLILGSVASHLSSAGFVETFWSFVAGHSSFELLAIVIFGGIGLSLGFDALAPGRKRRWHAIRDRTFEAMPLIYGGTLMLVMAAFVEAYWSSTTWPPPLAKYVVGVSFWVLHMLYFGLLGRRESR